MRVLVGGIALLFVAPLGSAEAGPVTAGVSLGLQHLESDAEVGDGSSQTIGLWGRLRFSSRVSGQLEAARHENPEAGGLVIRTGTALLVVDLMDSGRWMPTLLAGIGLDRADNDFSSQSGHHIEGGFGLEYRADGGLTLGADARLGGRSIDEGDVTIQPVAYFLPVQMRAGEYRAVRVTLGVRF